MTFEDLFQEVAGTIGLVNFFQATFLTESGVDISIAPRDNLDQMQHFTITDKDAFTATVIAAQANGGSFADAFMASLPQVTS